MLIRLNRAVGLVRIVWPASLCLVSSFWRGMSRAGAPGRKRAGAGKTGFRSGLLCMPGAGPEDQWVPEQSQTEGLHSD